MHVLFHFPHRQGEAPADPRLKKGYPPLKAPGGHDSHLPVGCCLLCPSGDESGSLHTLSLELGSLDILSESTRIRATWQPCLSAQAQVSVAHPSQQSPEARQSLSSERVCWTERTACKPAPFGLSLTSAELIMVPHRRHGCAQRCENLCYKSENPGMIFSFSKICP